MWHLQTIRFLSLQKYTLVSKDNHFSSFKPIQNRQSHISGTQIIQLCWCDFAGLIILNFERSQQKGFCSFLLFFFGGGGGGLRNNFPTLS